MRVRIDMNHPLTVQASRSMHAVHPLKLLGWIFGGVGLLFLLLGALFLFIRLEQLPQVFTAETWMGEPPDELALPIVGLVFSCIGAIFTVLGGVFLLILRRQKRLREELEQYGLRMTGVVTDIAPDRRYQVNGRHPLRVAISVPHPSTGEAVTVRSGLIWETSLSAGDPADVLFDPMDDKKRLVVLDEPGANPR